MRNIPFLKKALITFVLTGYYTSSQAVIVAGKDWRQVTDTVRISWNQMDSIYDTNTGLLDTEVSTISSGTGEVVDFAGYSWANATEVTLMLSTLSPDMTPNAQGTAFGLATTWAPELTQLFSPTRITDASNAVIGITRDISAISNLVVTANIEDCIPNNCLDIADYNVVHNTVALDDVGQWVYTTTTVVPVPAAAYLMATGLLGLIGFARKRASVVVV